LAASPVTDELTSLEEARARLEAELASDEHWRALQQPPVEGEAAEASAARQARNTRLKMALAGNPLYQAWRHLGQAIAALRATGADAQPPHGPAEKMPGVPLEQGSAQNSPIASKPQQAARRAADRAGPIAPPQPPVTAGKTTAGVDRASTLEPRGRPVCDPEEATVTFVRRESLLPSARLPADLGTDRDSALFERLRGLSEEQEPAAGGATFASPNDNAEEAEVTIVSAESARLRREAEERAGTIRRLRKALSGD